MKKKLLSTRQTAKQLNVSRQTLSNWNLPCKVKIGGKLYYKMRDIEKIKEVGMDNFLDWFAVNKTECQTTLEDILARMQQTLATALTMEDVDTIYRTYFLCSDQWLDLMALEYCNTVSVVEIHAEGEFQDIAFWGNEEECSIEEMHTALSEVAKTDLFIFRFNVLPREVFSALYQRLLINELILDIVEDQHIHAIYQQRQQQLTDFLFINAV